MPRLRLRIAYRGTHYHGWQAQPGLPTIQGSLLEAGAKLLALPQEAFTIQGASRTDAGVHALGQTAHLDHDTGRTTWDIVRGLNALTPADICVCWAEEVPATFHARHDSAGKTYSYQIWNHRWPHPQRLDDTWQVRHPLDLALLATGRRQADRQA